MSEAVAQKGTRRELYVRHARIDGRSVALIRAIDADQQCIVEVDVWPDAEGHPYNPEHAGPYTFPSATEATRFVTHAVETLIALGCDVRSA
ncbi:MAG TPA: hypothetical protein VMN35_02605 [Gaiellaceae bacterium]|nr:hypothetical protein [Gaiellaceae bacterium]